MSPTHHGPRQRVRRARDGGAPARPARNGERRCGSSARTWASARSAAASATRSISFRPAPTRGSPDAMRESSSGSASTRPASVVVRPRGARRSTAKTSRVPVLDSSPDTIRARTTRRRPTRSCTGSACPAPAFRRVSGAREVEAAARELGYPSAPVCFKPVFSSGSRGFRVLDPTVDRALSCSRSAPARWRCGSMRRWSSSRRGGPDLLVMQLANGGERTIDGIADGERDRSVTRRRASRCAQGSRCTS